MNKCKFNRGYERINRVILALFERNTRLWGGGQVKFVLNYDLNNNNNRTYARYYFIDSRNYAYKSTYPVIRTKSYK